MSEFDDFKPRMIRAMDSLMKNQSTPDCGINPDDSDVKNLLTQNRGGIGKEIDLVENRKMSVKVKWNKDDMYFGCSIAFLTKQNNGKWHCEGRFDDAHGCRHFDADFPAGKSKIYQPNFVEAKIQCPLLYRIINSLPKEQADEWKIKFFKEMMIANKRKEEYWANPNRVQFKR